MEFDPARCTYVPPLGGAPVALASPKPTPTGPPPTLDFTTITRGGVSTVTTTVTGDNADTARIRWRVTPAPAAYARQTLTGATAIFKHSAGSATITATLPRTDGGPDVVVTKTIDRSTGWKAGVNPVVATRGGPVNVEAAFGFATARTLTARLVRTASPGVTSERTVVATRTVDFPANATPVVLSEPLVFTQPSGLGEGWQFQWEVQVADDHVVVSRELPVWVVGTAAGVQRVDAAPDRVTYPAMLTRKATDSGKLTPTYGSTYEQNLTKFVQDWKATHLGGASPGGAWISFNEYNTQIYWVNLDDATVPRHTIGHLDHWEWGSAPPGFYGTDTTVSPPRSQVAVGVPIPHGAMPAPGTDRSLQIVGLRNGAVETIWELWIAERMADGKWRAAGIAKTNAADQFRHSAGYTVSASGLAFPLFALLIKEAQRAVAYVRAERAAGRTPDDAKILEFVPHAIGIGQPNPAWTGPTWPATHSDGAGTHLSAEEGQLVYIRPDADIAAAKLTPLKHVLAVVGKHRGFRVVDRTGWSSGVGIEGDQSYGGGLWDKIREPSEDWAVKFPDDWWVLGKRYRSQAEWDADTTSQTAPNPSGLTAEQRKEVALEVVSTAENATLDWTRAYSYIEDIGDGRGYTAGIVGWCSGTGDMLTLLRYAAQIQPGNVLAKWIDPLAQVMAAPYDQRPAKSQQLLGSAFITDWKTAAATSWFQQAQRDERDRVYWTPALTQATRDGVGLLGLTILYDISVNHGPGTDSESFGGIVATAQGRAKPPSAGGSEAAYLGALIDAREAVLKGWGDWQANGRQAAHRQLLANNPSMTFPVSWSMYGQAFTIPSPPTPRG